MKVLAHVPPIELAVAELVRLVRPGGHLLLEFYNPVSLRYLAKRVGGPGKIAVDGTTEKDVFTRFDTLSRARRYLPADVDSGRRARRAGGDAELAGVPVPAARPSLQLGGARRLRFAAPAQLRRLLDPGRAKARQRGLGRCPSPSSFRPAASSSPTTPSIRSPTTTTRWSAGSIATDCRWGSISFRFARRRPARAGDRRRQRRARPDAHQALRRIHRHRSDAGARARRAGRARLPRRISQRGSPARRRSAGRPLRRHRLFLGARAHPGRGRRGAGPGSGAGPRWHAGDRLPDGEPLS